MVNAPVMPRLAGCCERPDPFIRCASSGHIGHPHNSVAPKGRQLSNPLQNAVAPAGTSPETSLKTADVASAHRIPVGGSGRPAGNPRGTCRKVHRELTRKSRSGRGHAGQPFVRARVFCPGSFARALRVQGPGNAYTTTRRPACVIPGRPLHMGTLCGPGQSLVATDPGSLVVVVNSRNVKPTAAWPQFHAWIRNLSPGTRVPRICLLTRMLPAIWWAVSHAPCGPQGAWAPSWWAGAPPD